MKYIWFHPAAENFQCRENSCGNELRYKCWMYNFCIQLEEFCDGKVQCLYGDDEWNCGSIIQISFKLLNTYMLILCHNSKKKVTLPFMECFVVDIRIIL